MKTRFTLTIIGDEMEDAEMRDGAALAAAVLREIAEAAGFKSVSIAIDTIPDEVAQRLEVRKE